MACKWWATGEGATFRDRKKKMVSCTVCSVMVSVSYLKSHMAMSHAIRVPQNRSFDEVGLGPAIYVVSFPRVIQEVEYPVPG